MFYQDMYDVLDTHLFKGSDAYLEIKEKVTVKGTGIINAFDTLSPVPLNLFFFRDDAAVDSSHGSAQKEAYISDYSDWRFNDYGAPSYGYIIVE